MTDAIIAAGQRIMTGLAGTKTDRGFINAVKQYKIGNYILFSNNIESELGVPKERQYWSGNEG